MEEQDLSAEQTQELAEFMANRIVIMNIVKVVFWLTIIIVIAVLLIKRRK